LHLRNEGWLDIYRRYISLINTGYFCSIENIGYFRHFRYIQFLWRFVISFNATHCDYVLMSTVRVFCWLMTCALSIFSVLDNFCQIAPLHSNAVQMTRVLNLICRAHTHILLFGSKLYILAMYVQMLDVYIESIEKNLIYFFNILDIFENITIFSNPVKNTLTY